MRKLPRSLRFYVAASTFYAATIFLAVQYIYTFQLADSGILVARRDSGDVLASIQVVSFIVWIGISLIAAAVMHRLANALAGAKSAEEQREQELGSIFGLSASLAGPLELDDIGKRFLEAVRHSVRSDVTVALIVHDDVLEAFRVVGATGPHASDFADQVYSAASPTPRPHPSNGRRSRRTSRGSRGRGPSPPFHSPHATVSLARSSCAATSRGRSSRTGSRAR